MGRALLRESLKSKDFKIVEIIDRDSLPHSFEGIPVSTKPNLIPDVFVDFTTSGATGKNCLKALELGTPFVTGTTALSSSDNKALKHASEAICVVSDSNMSLGITCVKSLIKNASELLKRDFDVEIIEKHHKHKLDSPSGTAMSLYDCLPELKPIFGREGNQVRSDSEVGIHAVRAGGIFGEHSVIFASDNEMIEIKHSLISRSALASGALFAAKFASTSEPGLFSMTEIWEQMNGM